MRWGAVFVLAGVFVACGKKGEKAATREEALTACLAGCNKRVEQGGQPGSYEQGRRCDQICGCIVGEMFFANGERRKDPKLLGEVGSVCLQRVAATLTQPAHEAADEAADEDEAFDDAPPPPRSKRQRAAADARVSKAPFRPDPKVVLGPTLLAGKGCGGGARLPRLAYDEKGDRIRVVGQGLSWQLAWGGRYLERRDIAAVSTAPNYFDVISAIELFVVPRCDSYDNAPVFERMAARGLSELVPQADTVAQVRRGGWKVAETKSFSVHAAAVCPGQEPGSSFVNMCEWEYFKMLRSRAE